MEIEIRHAELADLTAIQSIYLQPGVVWGTLQLPYSPAEKQRKRLADPEAGHYPLVACVDGLVVGHLNLRSFPNSPRRKHAGGLGMGVHDDWQGKGIGTALMEAAIELAENWLNLTRLELTVWVDNEPAVRLYQKFSFEIEGTLRQFAFRAGELVDAYEMARLR